VGYLRDIHTRASYHCWRLLQRQNTSAYLWIQVCRSLCVIPACQIAQGLIGSAQNRGFFARRRSTSCRTWLFALSKPMQPTVSRSRNTKQERLPTTRVWSRVSRSSHACITMPLSTVVALHVEGATARMREVLKHVIPLRERCKYNNSPDRLSLCTLLLHKADYADNLSHTR
jgi:hypothetical protein